MLAPLPMHLRKAVLSSIVLGACALAGCSGNGNGRDEELVATPPIDGRNGSGGAGRVDDSKLYPESQCQRVGDERKLTEAADVHTVALLWDTDHYLLAYSDRAQGGGDIYTMRLGADGAPLGPPVLILSTPGFSKLPNLVKLPAGGYLLGWEDGSIPYQNEEADHGPIQAYVSVLNANGEPVGPPAPVARSEVKEARPVLGVGPNGPVLVWQEGDYPASNAFIAKVDPATGALVANSTKPLGAPNAGFPYLAGDPATGLAVVYSQATGPDTATIEYGQVDAALNVTTSQSMRSATGDARLARVIRRGTGFLAAWEDFRGLDDDGYPYEQLFMAMVDPTGVKSPDALVENPGTGSANWPNMASRPDGSASAIVYYQFRQSRPQIFLAFVDASGVKAGGDLQVSSTPAAANAKYPDVQWNGSSFGVSWIDTRDGAAQVYFATVACP